MSDDERQCLGLFGLFDVDAIDVQLRVRIAAHELAARRPDVTLRLFAPFGSTRPIAVAADLAVEPLAPLTTARQAALVDELAAVVVVGAVTAEVAAETEIAYPDHPAVDPRDVEAVVEFVATPPAELTIEHDPTDPHPALLARRVWPYGVCEQRREFLRAMHWWPQNRGAIVVAGTDLDLPHIDDLAERLLGRDVTIVGLGVGDDEFSIELKARLGARAGLIPASHSSMEDRVAACAGAAAVISNSTALLALADAYGRPRRTLEGRRATKRATETLARDEAALDASYDALAALVAKEPTAPLVDGEVAALRAALDAQARRIAHERVVLADYVRAVRNNTAQEIAALQAELERTPAHRVRNALRRAQK
jgi:hypothetical protein